MKTLNYLKTNFWNKQMSKGNVFPMFIAILILFGFQACEMPNDNVSEFAEQPSCGDCEEEEPPTPPEEGSGEGCTPGFWRQDHHFEYWTNYSPSDKFNTVFGVADEENPTLEVAINSPGQGINILRFHAVAGLLNAASAEVNYTYTESEVKQIVQEAYATGNYEHFKNQLAEANEADCTVDKDGDRQRL